MRVLVAEDDITTRNLLVRILNKLGYTTMEAEDGATAWHLLQMPGAPRLVVMDWLMPEMTGLEVCRKVRAMDTMTSPYIIMLTGQETREAKLQALAAGVDEFLTKPVDHFELQLRMEIGKRITNLQSNLKEGVEMLQKALEEVRTLQGIIPICQHCHRIRTDSSAWMGLESYVQQRTEAKFSHGICPDCVESIALPALEALRKSRETPPQVPVPPGGGPLDS